MQYTKYSLKRDAQVTKLVLSVAAVLAAVPLLLSARTPTQATPTAPPVAPPVSQADVPEVPAAISLRTLAAPGTDLKAATQTGNDTGQAARDTSPPIAPTVVATRQNTVLPARTQTTPAVPAPIVPPLVRQPVVPALPAGGLGAGGAISPAPVPDTAPAPAPDKAPAPAPAPEPPETEPASPPVSEPEPSPPAASPGTPGPAETPDGDNEATPTPQANEEEPDESTETDGLSAMSTPAEETTVEEPEATKAD